ncbi:MAG TPA: hypothetical protein VD926_14770 [Acidimicrobiales bacterium]|nr:hypothetical protein [Acidimicrobiales bacterium]
MSPSLADQLLAVHRSLEGAQVPHAFGGALALAWCTQQARATIDIDVNVFVPPERAQDVLGALPAEVTWTEVDVATIERDGQVRVWWDETPLDVFTNTTAFHEEVGERIRFEDFAGESVPFLDCRDLAVFKAFFDRTKDWADLEAMVEAGTLDVAAVVGVLARHLGTDDHRIERLLSLA